jgi:hypothetical protein
VKKRLRLIVDFHQFDYEFYKEKEMADFRKLFFALAVVALLVGTASTASAQQGSNPAFTCQGNAGVPPIVRAEGLSELVGDMILNCTGGVITPTGSSVPQVNVQIFLNTNITSKLTADPASEALLMIDEPSAATQVLCTNSATGTGCPVTGVGATALGTDGQTDGVDYESGLVGFQNTSSVTRTAGVGGATVSGTFGAFADPNNLYTVPNVFQGRQVGANSLIWLGVPIDPPGSNFTRIIRITNVRANANQLGVSSTLVPSQIVMNISATGTTSVPINNPQQTVAFVQTGLTFAVRSGHGGGTLGSFLQCTNFNTALSTNPSATYNGATSNTNPGGRPFLMRFSEGFPSSFKKRSSAAFASADVSPTVPDQATPNQVLNVESGFERNVSGWNVLSGQSSATNPNAAGVATQGTRLKATFNNIPAGVVLYASVYEIVNTKDDPPSNCAGTVCAGVAGTTSTGPSTQNLGTLLGTGGNTTASTSRARLIITDSQGSGSFSPASATSTSDGGLAPLPIANGSATAVWEVMDSNPLNFETFYFAIAPAFTANPGSNLPGIGTMTTNGSFAPLSTVTTASASAPVPRFADTSRAINTARIVACATDLLFPFLTNQAGFDSGFVISNTSQDPFGTTPQAGTCKLNYYGGTTGGGAAPPAQTSAVVASGAQLTAVLSTGGNLGVAATPGFQGYMIAQCAFQFAHGFAFISDVGASRLAESYLALVMDAQYSGFPRTGVESEVLGH